MRALILVFAPLVPHVASAGKVGVVVTGEYLTTPIRDQTSQWLKSHGQRVVAKPMPRDAIKTLVDCFVIDDTKCSRSVVEARAITPSIVAMRVEVTSKKKREILLTAYWIVKGHNGVSLRRTCEQCTESVLRTTVDAMMLDLAKLSPGFMGRVMVTSTPPGLTVLLDNATIGVTPVERDVSAGQHTLALTRDGRTGPAKAITVEPGGTADVDLKPPREAPRVVQHAPAPTPPPPPPPPHERPSRAFPGVLIGLGVAGIGAGATLYFTSEKMTGAKPNYRDTRTLGIGVAAGGGAVLLLGTILMFRGGDSAPTVAAIPGGGAYVGWTGRF